MVPPEDDANSQLANGFVGEVEPLRQRRIQILNPAGGWMNVLQQFVNTQAPSMRRFPHRTMIFVLDFDNQLEARRAKAKELIPEDLAERTFVLGPLSEPEQLPQGLENMGSALARDCRDGTELSWSNQLLRHNLDVLQLLRPRIHPILFGEA